MSNNPVVQSGFAPVQGGELYFESAGAGRSILLIHAGVADSSMWDEQFGVFYREFHVIRFDARGYGRSITQSVEYSTSQDIIDLLDFLHVDSVCALGLSRGGYIAIDFAIEHPERTWALIAVAAGMSGFQPAPDGSPKSQAEQEMFARLDAVEQTGDIAALNELEVCLWADGPGQPEGRAAASVRDRVRRMNLATFDRKDGKPVLKSLQSPALNRLYEIKIPALSIVGDLDTTSVLAISDLFASGIAGARRKIIPGVAHMVNMEIPEQFNQIVLEFLRNE
jgi:3-oxoadipate enol-lactonase